MNNMSKEKNFTFFVNISWSQVLDATDEQTARDYLKEIYANEYNIELQDHEIELYEEGEYED